MVAPLQILQQTTSTALHIGAGLGTCASFLTAAELVRRVVKAGTDYSPVGMPEMVKEYAGKADDATWNITSDTVSRLFPYRDDTVHSKGKLATTAVAAFLVSTAVFELTHRFVGQPFSLLNNVSALQFRGDSLVGKAASLVRG